MFAVSLHNYGMQLNCTFKIGTNTCEESTPFPHYPLHIQAVTRETNDKRLPCALSANCLGATTMDGGRAVLLCRPWLGCSHLMGTCVEQGRTSPVGLDHLRGAVMLFPHCSSGSSFRAMLIFPSCGLQADASAPPPHSRDGCLSAVAVTLRSESTRLPNLMTDDVFLKTCSSGLIPEGEGEESPTFCILLIPLF